MSKAGEVCQDHGRPSFLPRGAVTGIGSLPISEPDQAIEFVAEHSPVVPFCPQPPAADLAADTLEQQLGTATSKAERWLECFVDAAIAGAFPLAIALKTQLTGPLTLSGLLRARGSADAAPRLLTSLAEQVARRAARQVASLRVAGFPVVVVVDEPALVLCGSPPYARPERALQPIIDRIRRGGAWAGLHCCAASGPGWVGSFDADLLSFDASEDRAPDKYDVAVLDDDRRLVAFGLIGAAPPPEPSGLAFSRWLAAAARVADPTVLACRTIVTTRCGLGRSTLSEAEGAFRAASAVSRLVGEFAWSAQTRTVPGQFPGSRSWTALAR